MRSLDPDEVMHPGVGPLIEARELYVEQSQLGARLSGAGARSPLVLFDVGLGAGSNAVAAWEESERAPLTAARLELISFERDLGAIGVALGHASAFGLEGAAGAAVQGLLDAGVYATTRTRWRLERGDVLRSLGLQTVVADVVFWDPFSPRANPSLWTVAAFAAVRRAAGPECTLFTYSASTAVRVALLLAGWAVGLGAATGGKAATTVAAARAQDLARPLDGRWLGRLSRPEVPLPSDAPVDAIARVAAAPQFRTQGQGQGH